MRLRRLFLDSRFLLGSRLHDWRLGVAFLGVRARKAAGESGDKHDGRSRVQWIHRATRNPTVSLLLAAKVR